MIFIPAVIFLATVLWAWLAGSNSERWQNARPTVVSGSVGLGSAIVTAYLIHDRSQKIADLHSGTHTSDLAAGLLVAHAILFVALLLKRA